jgi:type II secretory pathway pseudopilin PulG
MAANLHSPGKLRRASGFTLLEASLVTVIIGVGVVGMLQLLASGTAANADGAELSMGMNLARNVREMSLSLSFTDPTTPTRWGLDSGESLSALSFDDLNDLDGATFSPPLDARKQRLNDLTTWSQTVTVQTVSPDWLTLDVTRGTEPAARVTVIVQHHGHEVCRLSWYAFEASQ